MRYVVAGLAVALALCGWGLWAQVEKNGALVAKLDTAEEAIKQAQEQREKDRKVLVARASQIRSQARELAQAREGLSQALRANKDWSDTNVPTDVQKALSGRSDGSN